MRFFPLIFLVTFMVSSTWVFAKPPQQPRLMQFSRLWTNSPFTIKPTAATPTVASPLERDWSLGSIRPSGNGYSVTLINKKNRKERIRFVPGFSSGDFKLLEVKQNTQSSDQSKVLVSKGGQKAWITYDEKVIKLRVAKGSKSSRKSPSKKSSKHSKSRSPIPSIPGKSKSIPRIRHVPRK